MNTIRVMATIQGIINSMRMLPKIALFLSLSVYVFFENAITARNVFIVMIFFNRLSILSGTLTFSLTFA